MNKLTGKSKEDFLEYIADKHFNIDYKKEGTCEYLWIGNDIDLTIESPYLLNALIIEWLDSVGVFISIEHNKKVGFMYILDECCENGFLTRQEATEKAIEQANLIYNERN